VSETATLFRPVGDKELDLIRASGMRRIPPRLPDQPIFYPVTNEAYAVEIARDWNTQNDGARGHVTRFDVAKAYADRFERRIVGGRQHEELWVPAEELDEFNSNIIGEIEVTASFSAADRLAFAAQERASKGAGESAS
jgi:hypothetical protein